MTDKELLEIYMQGFNDELMGELSIVPNNELSKKAYNMGRIDALVGDDVPSVDLRTNNEILEKIKKYE